MHCWGFHSLIVSISRNVFGKVIHFCLTPCQKRKIAHSWYHISICTQKVDSVSWIFPLLRAPQECSQLHKSFRLGYIKLNFWYFYTVVRFSQLDFTVTKTLNNFLYWFRIISIFLSSKNSIRCLRKQLKKKLPPQQSIKKCEKWFFFGYVHRSRYNLNKCQVLQVLRKEFLSKFLS